MYRTPYNLICHDDDYHARHLDAPRYLVDVLRNVEPVARLLRDTAGSEVHKLLLSEVVEAVQFAGSIAGDLATGQQPAHRRRLPDPPISIKRAAQ